MIVITCSRDRDHMRTRVRLTFDVVLEIVFWSRAAGGSILWFDPRREHSSVPTAKSHSRRAQGLSRLAASSRPPEGLGLDGRGRGRAKIQRKTSILDLCVFNVVTFAAASRDSASSTRFVPVIVSGQRSQRDE